MKLLLATANVHKHREFARLLRGHEIDLLPAAVELGPEDGDTYAANALGKARVAARACAKLAFADDSGIEAEALNGAPGIRSARYAGEGAGDAENLAKLRREVPVGSALRYVCAIAVVDPASGIEAVFTGNCDGTLAAAPTGGGGFGYDPVFIPAEPPGDGTVTMAQLRDTEKDAISHRGRAARDFDRWLAANAG